MANEKPETSIEEQVKFYQLEEAKQRLEMTKQQVNEFKEKEADKERIRRIRVDAVKKEKQETERRQRQCRHKTGGKGKPGFLHGDGAKGFCVGQIALPTGELYLLCSRCQKEWHHPTWIVKIEVYNTGNTAMTQSQYDRMLTEYNEALNWDHPYTEMMEASQFKVPLLDMIDIKKIPLAKESA